VAPHGDGSTCIVAVDHHSLGTNHLDHVKVPRASSEQSKGAPGSESSTGAQPTPRTRTWTADASTHTHTLAHARKHMRTRMHPRVHTHAQCSYARIHTCTNTSASTRAQLRTHAHTHTSDYLSIKPERDVGGRRRVHLLHPVVTPLRHEQRHPGWTAQGAPRSPPPTHKRRPVELQRAQPLRSEGMQRGEGRARLRAERGQGAGVHIGGDGGKAGRSPRSPHHTPGSTRSSRAPGPCT